MAEPPAPTPYGRRRVAVLGDTPPAGRESMPTYYGRPALKASEWRWLIITYFFVGGLAGAAQLIAGTVDLLGHRRHRALIKVGRFLGLAGALVSPLLLIGDLHTPSRWYNMLRIYRRTSPMSIGSWTLVAFGTSSGLAALAQVAADLFGLRAARPFARYTGILAGASGAVIATYTGSLLAVTSVPFWAINYRLLPALFATSGMSTAVAALSLILSRIDKTPSSQRQLARLAVLVGTVELAMTLDMQRVWKREQLAAALDRPRLALAYRVGVLGLGILAPLGVHLAQTITGREHRGLSTLASLAALVGGYSLRAVLVLGGHHSAERPADYFKIAQPDHVDDLSGRGTQR